MAATPIRRYQAAALSLRGIRSRRGRTNATVFAIERHETTKAAAVAEILATGDLDAANAVGLLTEEEKLAERLRGVPRGERPELRQRLNDIRTCLQRLDRS